MMRLRANAILAVCLFLAVSTGIYAGEKTGFVNKTHKGKDGDAKYVVFIPKDYDGKKEFPVIVFLHGSGETGTDGQKQVKVGLGKAIRDKKQQFEFITVFPQSQKGGWKAESDGGKLAVAILDDVQKDYKTDKKRVYLTGMSMGGSGSWSLAAAYPNRWAAVAPICGGGSLASVSKIKNLPIWFFCGDKDSAKLVENNRNMAKALKEAGSTARYEEYPGVPHNSWDRAYATTALYPWFLKHSTK